MAARIRGTGLYKQQNSVVQTGLNYKQNNKRMNKS